MGYLEILLLAVGLSMDAFAVSICKGLAFEKVSWKQPVIVGLWFGGFQALMPTLGYFLGSAFETYIARFDHWIAFVLLLVIGANMIRESFASDEEKVGSSLAFGGMLAMAVATSIDAMATGIAMIVGFTFAPAVGGDIPALLISVCTIGLTTFVISCAGVKIGNTFGGRYKSWSERIGGVILILLGVKILVEHLSAGVG